MDFTGSPWVVIRLIDKQCGRTITEHIEMEQKRGQPSFNISNRAVMEGRPVTDVRTIRSCPHKQTLLTCVHPAGYDNIRGHHGNDNYPA